MQVPTNISELSFLDAIVKLITLELGTESFQAQYVGNTDERNREFHFLANGRSLTFKVEVYPGRYENIGLWRLFEGQGVEGKCIFETTKFGSRVRSDHLALNPQAIKHSKRVYEDKSKTSSQQEVEWAKGMAMELSKAIRDYLGKERAISRPKTKSNKGAKAKSKGPLSISEILGETYPNEVLFPEPTHKASYSETLRTVVPESVLNSFSLSSAERTAVTNIVKRVISDIWLTWDNHESVIKKLVNKTYGYGSHWWQAKYPDFDSVVSKFTKEGRDPLQGAVIVAWFAVAVSLVFVTAASPYVVAVALLMVAARRFVFRPTYSPGQLLQVKNDYIEQLESHYRKEIASQVKSHVKQAFGLTKQDWKNSVNGLWQPHGPRPIEPQREMTPIEAEEFVGQLLRYFGVTGAKTTRYSRDGGVDVEAVEMVAQVKHQQNPVGVGVVREIFGVATHKGKIGAVFAKSGFTKEAVDFAQNTQIPLITYLPKLKGHTKIGQALIDGGWPRMLEHRDNQK
jgi:hypothetical protein